MTNLLIVIMLSAIASAQIPNFEHIVVIVQENRTPDNLFQALCQRAGCPSPYNLQDFGVNSKGQKIKLTPVPLAIPYDLGHRHSDFVAECDLDPTTNQCRMNGADKTRCTGICPPNFPFQYVRASDIGPYLTLALNYGWANFMFQTNQGPSTPAHQFIFAGTSAPTAALDRAATFVADNPQPLNSNHGCLDPLGQLYQLISPSTAPGEFNLINNPLGTVCFSHATLASLLDSAHKTWKYYAPSSSNLLIWMAPNWIREICEPNPSYAECTGPEWKANVDQNPTDVLSDIKSCNLRNMSWVIPTGANSDHASSSGAGGPSWVASIVNAVGTSGCGYWKSTAIVITWDDWGGWYDHVPPILLSKPNAGQGDYQYGFRVPLLVVSAYTPVGYVNDQTHDFGSIIRFVEHNFGLPLGGLGFADERAVNAIDRFFDLSRAPRPFQHISAPVSADYFLNNTSPMEPPDDD